MRIKLIPIGNSKGIRIPKALLEESGISGDLEIKVTSKGLTLTPLKTSEPISETTLLSEKVLARDWNRPEEDAAWDSL